MKTVFKIAVIESEAGWGRKIDDYMVCLSPEDAEEFKKEFNAKNTSKNVPDWYMACEGDPEPFEIDKFAYSLIAIESDKRIWLSRLNSMS